MRVLTCRCHGTRRAEGNFLESGPLLLPWSPVGKLRSFGLAASIFTCWARLLLLQLFIFLVSFSHSSLQDPDKKCSQNSLWNGQKLIGFSLTKTHVSRIRDPSSVNTWPFSVYFCQNFRGSSVWYWESTPGTFGENIYFLKISSLSSCDNLILSFSLFPFLEFRTSSF